MASRNISFSEFPRASADILVDALGLAIRESVDHSDIVFNEPANYTCRLLNSYAKRYAVELLSVTISARTIFAGTEAFIANALQYVINAAEQFIYAAEESVYPTAELALAAFASGKQIEINHTSLFTLRALARALAPHAEVYSTRKVHDDTMGTDLYDFVDAFYNHISRDESDIAIDYGQHNVGIVVDHTLFDFPPDHPVIEQLSNLLQQFDHTI